MNFPEPCLCGDPECFFCGGFQPNEEDDERELNVDELYTDYGGEG